MAQKPLTAKQIQKQFYKQHGKALKGLTSLPATEAVGAPSLRCLQGRVPMLPVLGVPPLGLLVKHNLRRRRRKFRRVSLKHHIKLATPVEVSHTHVECPRPGNEVGKGKLPAGLIEEHSHFIGRVYRDGEVEAAVPVKVSDPERSRLRLVPEAKQRSLIESAVAIAVPDLKDGAAIAENKVILPVAVEVAHPHGKLLGNIRRYALEGSIPGVQKDGISTENVQPAISIEIADDKIRTDGQGNGGELVRPVSIQDLIDRNDVRMAVAVHVYNADWSRIGNCWDGDRRRREASSAVVGPNEYAIARVADQIDHAFACQVFQGKAGRVRILAKRERTVALIQVDRPRKKKVI